MLRRPMSFLLSRINSATRRYLPLVAGDDDNQNNDNMSIFVRIQEYWRVRLGPILPVIVFLGLLTLLVFVAVISNGENSPFKNVNDLSETNHTSNSYITKPDGSSGSHGSSGSNGNISKQHYNYDPISNSNSTASIKNNNINGNGADEIGILTIAFFTLMTTWAVVQTLRIMRNFATPASLQREIALTQILNSADRSNLWFDDNFQRRLRMTLMRRDFTGNDYELLQQLDEEIMNNNNNGGGMNNTTTGGISGSRSSRGARQDFIDRLPSHVINHSENETQTEEVRYCSICLGPLEDGDTVRTLFCLHQFHQHCVDNWLRQNASCPICKASILE